MRGALKSIFGFIIILGIALAIWRMTGGDVGGFFEMILSVIYGIIEAVGNFFFNIFGMFGF